MDFERAQWSDFADQDSEAAAINISKELNETMQKDVKAGMRTMSHQIKNIQNEMQTIKENQMEILELKSQLTETKKFTRGTQQ